VDEREKRRRLFAGIDLDDAAASACAAVSERLRQTGFDARYEPPDKLHVTLAFLGNVVESRYEAVASALPAAAAGAASFVVSLDKLGAFPHERKPRVVYIGAREQGAAYRALAASVRAAYAAIGFSFEADPVAHVTIARVKEPRRALPSIEFAPVELRVGKLSLFESIFDARLNTSRYRIVGGAALLPPASANASEA
jgi:2'-5' RNA ligase